ncbi:PIN domain-containing protein [Candidatus Daviesbacteria bacterium]|nr:PIN domain-containing protein [Candidatus Daviesbacteria bacterium]MBI4035334.1 PIN domain-containing protein [Candidatus Daviesbacteria bacterium]
MKSLLADANIFLRFFLNDVPAQQKKAAQLLQKAKDKKLNLVVPQIIIFEIEFILSKYYLFPKNEIIDRLQSIVGVAYLDIQDKEIFQRALNIYKEKNLSLVDCFLVAKSEIEEVDIFTFDQKLSALK